MASDPIVVQIMREFKAGLLWHEQDRLREMVRRWRDVEAALQAQIDLLAEEVARGWKAGQLTTAGQLYRIERYQALVAQARREIQQYESWLTGRITTWQQGNLALGVEQAAAVIEAAGIRVAFTHLPVSAVEYMAGFCADGAPLFDLLRGRALNPEAVDGLTRALVDAIAQGWNPRKTARRMADGLAQGLEKARVIARTEQLRAYRSAMAEQYRQSGVVRAMRRLAAKDDRTCLACLARDGELIPLEREIDDHPQGRCTAVPVILGAAPLEWQTGAQWFQTLSADQQRTMMGDKLYELWGRGKGFDFTALARTTHSETWGDGLRVATYAEMEQTAAAARKKAA
jgi:SPP1 gp7 family putative phage head morphogenesis protein